MFAKVHKRARVVGGNSVAGRVVALCDAELLGKVFEEGDLCLDLARSKGFYEGTRVSEEKAVEFLKSADSVNVVGEKSVAAVKKAFGSAAGVVRIAGVPHLQVYRV